MATDAQGWQSPARGLQYTNKALADLEAVAGWLTQPRAGRAARRKLATIRAAIRRLRSDPCLFPTGQHTGVPELPATAATGRYTA